LQPLQSLARVQQLGEPGGHRRATTILSRSPLYINQACVCVCVLCVCLRVRERERAGVLRRDCCLLCALVSCERAAGPRVPLQPAPHPPIPAAGASCNSLALTAGRVVRGAFISLVCELALLLQDEEN